MKKATASNLKLSGVLTFAVLLMGLVFYLSRSVALVIVFSVGLLVVSAAVGLAVLVQKRLEKRKLRKAGASGAAPPKDEAKAREKLAELRRSFTQGFEQFQSAGRNVYEVPWYLMTGLSGVGKTEAIRHSGLSFPASVQDQEQGKGGTRTLQWWFTNQAVILDTIGEWFLEEDGEYSEWIELFRLLKHHRPAAPFNGVILAISAESLLMDDEEKIKKKAATIARKLDAVQRFLELRFPVFVMVTKTDMVTGFREFFDSEEEPPYQKKMLGWSNPAGLDEPVPMDRLDDHFEPLFHQLREHRLHLFARQPGKSAPARSPDQLHRLFAFPDNLQRVLGKLKLYLEAAFLPGEWSRKPLFLRGVYFTSAKQDGWELDVELSERFPIPSSDRISEANPGRHRAHFLHDVFLEKIFEEKGLVLRAASARSHQRWRRILTWGTAFAVLAVFILLTRLSFSSLQETIGEEQGFWEAAAEKGQWTPWRGSLAWRPLVVRASGGTARFAYRGTETLTSGETFDTPSFLRALGTRTAEPLDIPWIFSLSADISGDLDRSRPRAARALFESSVLRPVLEAAREKIRRRKADLWSSEATAALAQLVRLEVQKRQGLAAAAEGELVDLEALLRFVLEDDPGGLETFQQQHRKALSETLEALYGADAGADWPPASLGAGGAEARRTVEQGRNQFLLHWMHQIDSQKVNPHLRGIAHLAEAGLLFAEAEQALWKVNAAFTTDSALPATLLIHNRLTGTWERHYGRMDEARAVLKKYEGILASGSLEKAYDEKGRQAMEELEASFGLLLAQLAGLPEKGEKKEKAADGGEEKKKEPTFLERLDAELEAELLRLKSTFREGPMRENVRRLDKEVFPVVKAAEFGRKAVRAYEARFDLYRQAHELLGRRLPSADAFTFPDAYQRGRQEINQVREGFRSYLAQLGATEPSYQSAHKAAVFACRLAERVLTFASVKSTFDSVLHGDGLAAQAERRARNYDPIPRTRLFMAAPGQGGGSFEARFHVKAMRDLLRTRETLVGLLGDPRQPGDEPEAKLLEGGELSRLFDLVDRTVRGYFHDYARYWMDVIRRGFRVDPFAWKDFVEGLAEQSDWNVNSTLLGTLNVVDNALEDAALPLDKERAQAVADLRREIKGGRERLKSLEGQDNPFVLKCKTVIAAWKELRAESAAGVRLVLLQLKPEKLMEKYVVQGSGSSRDVVLLYWESLTRQAVGSVADAFQKNAAAELPKLPRFRAFPLARPDGKNQLSVEDVAEARRVLDRVRPNPTTLPRGSIGLGARTGVPAMDPVLDKLALLDMPPETRAWIGKADPILAALPAKADEPFQCEVTLLKAQVQRNLVEESASSFEAVSGLLIWRSMAMHQGERTAVRRADTEQTEDQVLGKLQYPGERVKIDFFQNPSDKLPNRTMVEEGPWGALLLLHRTEARRFDKPETWLVPFTLKDAKGHERKLWVTLTFDRVLPERDQWPSPK